MKGMKDHVDVRRKKTRRYRSTRKYPRNRLDVLSSRKSADETGLTFKKVKP